MNDDRAANIAFTGQRHRGAFVRAAGLATCVLLSLSRAQSPQVSTNIPIKNFSLPSFNEAGFRTMLIRGRELTRVGTSEASVRDMTLTVFSGDESARVENVLLSPSARFQSDRRVVFGDESVRLISDTFELTGTQWRYDHERKIFSAKNARVVFQAELKDIVK